MSRILARLAIVLAVVLGGSLPVSPAWADTVSLPLRDAVASLPVAAEDRTGYDRDLFPLWVDADGDGCNTRYEVLIAEATTAPTVGSGCSLSGGEWYSIYQADFADFRRSSLIGRILALTCRNFVPTSGRQ